MPGRKFGRIPARRILFLMLLLSVFAPAVDLSAAAPKDAMPPVSEIAAQPSAPVFSGKTSMNGYSLKDFPDFIKNFHFVTVRYRKDTGEMRFTYANDKAWKALLAGEKNYPDGAVFAKIGVMTNEDPGFTSSVVPSGAQRYQLMVMDHKKHAETDGWGYALFGMNGLTFEQGAVEQTAACHACHRSVPERGYVFSQPARLEIGLAGAMQAKENIVPADRVSFVTQPVNRLAPKISEVIPSNFKDVRVMTGELAKNIFQGTIDEIRPMLAKETAASKLPAALVNEKGDRFSLVFPGGTAACVHGSARMTAYFTIKPAGTSETDPIRSFSFCQAAPP